MRVAFPMRVDAHDKPGGDLLQVERYLAWGEASGDFRGEVLTGLNEDLAGFDLVHLTNIDRPVDTWRAAEAAQRAGKPVVLSPIHHGYREIERFEREARSGLAGAISGRMRFATMECVRSVMRAPAYPALLGATAELFVRGVAGTQRELLGRARRILVLSEKEARDLALDFGAECLAGDRVRLLRNGFAPALFAGAAPERDLAVAVVGRIEERKNQRSILRVLEGMGLQGVFVGRENPNHRAYCLAFRREVAASRSQYLGECSQAETARLLRRTRVHVSASWFEVLSMVDLEAYCAGCAVVSSRCGGTAELLGEAAEYVDPGSEESLRGAMARAMARGGGDGRELPRLESWEEIGAKLTRIYREVLAEAGRAAGAGR